MDIPLYSQPEGVIVLESESGLVRDLVGNDYVEDMEKDGEELIVANIVIK